MTGDFPKFGEIVNKSFQSIVKTNKVFEVNIDGDALFAAYLAAFPAGADPMFKTRTEHDCSCCKQFIRRAGLIVAVNEHTSEIKTVWDDAAEKAPYPYNEVASKLRDLVKAASIAGLYRVGKNEGEFGTKESHSEDKEKKKVLTWNHFYTGDIPASFRAESPAQIRGDYQTASQVFERGLRELKPEAIETVLSLISSNALYRGEEHKPALVAFQKTQNQFLSKNARGQHLFIWTRADSPASRLRNSVIGTLVQDLSEDKELEQAVKSFEAKVAPQNYKRTTALITPMMIKKAMQTIQELGLEPALERRFAKIDDISVNDVKWVDTGVKPLMKGGLGDVLMEHASIGRKDIATEESRAEEIGLEAFMSTVIPSATGIELLLKGEHLGNLMSLTAPVHTEPKALFRWNNDFAWSYCGGVADSIKERVKKAGGKVEGTKLRISLSWFNYDDLDLHVYEPAGRGVGSLQDHIFFRNKRGWTNGQLDVDMNAGSGSTRQAVENVYWENIPPNGAYKVVVNNYSQRETKDVGFVIEVENNGKLSHFSFNKTVRNQQDITVVTLHVKGGVIERFETGDPSITASNISQEKWGLKTEQYVKVNAVVLSPNYWGDNAVGNKHTFFILDGAKNDEPTRGIYNEFLNPRLEQHRKVFEVIGEKTKCQPTEGQLSGVGFSSTKHESVLVKVAQGKKQRLFNVKTGA
jgi:hypothetical protein